MRDDYDNSWDRWATTNPNHGGKMTVKEMAEKIEQYQLVCNTLIDLEQPVTSNGLNKNWAYIPPGGRLAEVIQAARALTGRDNDE